MSLAHGSSIVNSGLVFHYDASNTQKSWMGAPTTNLYSGTASSAGTVDGFGGGSYLDTTLSSSSPFNNEVTYARKSNSGVATWSVQANLTEGVTYTYSVWCKTVTWTNITMRRNEPGVYSAENKSVTVLPDVWTRVSFTFTVNTGKSGSQVVGIGVGDANVGQSNPGIFLYGAQLEQNTFSTPFVTTSRSNTQAIIDLTRKNTVTANALTYNSDGTFKFDGVDDYISIPNTTNTRFSNISPWSVQFVFKVESFVNAFPGIMVLGSASSSGVLLYYNNANNVIWKHNNLQSTIASYTIGETIVMCLTFDGSTVRSYKNGQYQADGVAMSLTDTSSTLLIGRGDAFGNHYIYSSSKWDRSLSATEVKQNFEALRGRYGL